MPLQSFEGADLLHLSSDPARCAPSLPEVHAVMYSIRAKCIKADVAPSQGAERFHHGKFSTIEVRSAGARGREVCSIFFFSLFFGGGGSLRPKG